MRILVVSNHYPPLEVGGYEQLCRDVTDALAERGHETLVLTSTYGTAGAALPEQPDVQRVLRMSPDWQSGRPVVWQFAFDRREAEAHNLQVLRTAVRDFTPDVVFFWNLAGLPRSLATDAEAMPAVAVAHWLAGESPAAPDEYWHYWQEPPRRTSARLVWRLARSPALAQMRREGKPLRPALRHAAAVSRFVRDVGVADGTLPETTSVIYNGVETDAFYRPARPAPHEPLRLLQAGRLSAEKGVHSAVAAVATLAQRGLAVELAFAGDGPPDYRAELEAFARRNGIADCIRFTGRLPRAAMPDLFAQHDVLLLPSIHPEPFARVVLEAMAAGLVVVAAATGGTPEIVEDGHTGLLFLPEDDEGLSAGLVRLTNEPGLWHALAVAGQRRVLQDFTLARMVDNVEALLAAAVADDSKSTTLPVTVAAAAVA